MRPILTVTTPTTDPLLLTEAEARQAIGVSSGRDAEVLRLRKSVTDAITSLCNVWTGGTATPTLLLETLSQQVRLECPVEQIRLVRRPVVEVLTVTEVDILLSSDSYELDAEVGLLRRLWSDWPSWWCVGKTVITYRAGLATIPDGLREAAMRYATATWARAGRDPDLRRIDIPNVISKEFWVPPSDDPLFSSDIQELLGDFINPAMA